MMYDPSALALAHANMRKSFAKEFAKEFFTNSFFEWHCETVYIETMVMPVCSNFSTFFEKWQVVHIYDGFILQKVYQKGYMRTSENYLFQMPTKGDARKSNCRQVKRYIENQKGN